MCTVPGLRGTHAQLLVGAGYIGRCHRRRRGRQAVRRRAGLRRHGGRPAPVAQRRAAGHREDQGHVDAGSNKRHEQKLLDPGGVEIERHHIAANMDALAVQALHHGDRPRVAPAARTSSVLPAAARAAGAPLSGAAERAGRRRAAGKERLGWPGRRRRHKFSQLSSSGSSAAERPRNRRPRQQQPTRPAVWILMRTSLCPVTSDGHAVGQRQAVGAQRRQQAGDEPPTTTMPSWPASPASGGSIGRWRP